MTKGKYFEKLFSVQAGMLQGVYVHRIVDQMTYRKGSFNIADFITYKYPTMYFVELKTTAQASLPRANIAETQLRGMYGASKTKGIKAYIICWFYEKDVCRAFPIDYVWKQFNVHKKKSLRFDDEHGLLITGIKRKSYWQWDWYKLFGKKESKQ